MSHADEAAELFRSGHACSQAVVLPWARELGLDVDPASRQAAAFAAGMRVGDVCGAVTGAFMVLGLAVCDDECVTKPGRAAVGVATATFAKRFAERVGALDCPDVIGCDLRTPEGQAQSMEQQLFASRCVPAVRAAAEILEEMLAENPASA